ncbi:MAG: alpha-galactosidase, partial [Clostridiales bacterium]|nr:alpha-galactosidase [Clostridiales bacterium]
QNTVYRSFFNDRLFGNDPDVFLLRDDNIKLSADQKRALLTLNALFGSVLMTSDNLGEYDEAKRKLLSDALDLFYNASVTAYTRNGDAIAITYEVNGKSTTIKYDTKRGILL